MWLPAPPDAAALSVEAQRDDSSSMLVLYRELLGLRRRLEVLRSGSIEVLDAPEGVVRYLRRTDGAASEPAEVEIAVNFTDRAVRGAVSDCDVLLSTHPDLEAVGTDLAADEARVVLR